jgi:hypothetical protein
MCPGRGKPESPAIVPQSRERIPACYIHGASPNTVATMQFEDALSVLAGWLGEELEVTLHGANGMPPILAAELFGILRGIDELSGGHEPTDSLAFLLDSADGDEVGTFVLDKNAFQSAGWYDRKKKVLEITCGMIQILICRADTDGHQS